MRTEEKIVLILRCIAAGEKTIFENENGAYFKEDGEGRTKRTVESRLQFELYGEYPLSPTNEIDWLNVRASIRF